MEAPALQDGRAFFEVLAGDGGSELVNHAKTIDLGGGDSRLGHVEVFLYRRCENFHLWKASAPRTRREGVSALYVSWFFGVRLALVPDLFRIFRDIRREPIATGSWSDLEQWHALRFRRNP